MKAWSAALKAEIGDWPGVKVWSFFGFTALYRRGRIFALHPQTRGMETPNSLAFKLQSPAPRLLVRMRRDPRIGSTEMQKGLSKGIVDDCSGSGFRLDHRLARNGPLRDRN